MKRGRLGLAAAMLIAAATGLTASSASHGEACETAGGHLYKYCGHHWASSPIRIKVVWANGNPLSQAALTSAAKAAALEWNSKWPRIPSPQVDNCLPGVLFCFPSSGALVVIQFGPTQTTESAATTWLTYSGEHITKADVNLNAMKLWGTVAPSVQLVTGETPGLTGTGCPQCANFLDLQNVLTHELGHVLGLDHLVTTCGTIFDAMDWGQTMYGCTQAGDTSRRTLNYGDILGLARVAMDY